MNIYSKYFTRFIIVAYLLLTLGLLVFGLNMIADLHQLRKSEEALFEENRRFNDHFEEFQRSLGFGGFIHNIKEFLVKRDAAQLFLLERNIQELENSYSGLREHFDSNEAEPALLTLDKFVASLKQKYHLLQRPENEELPLAQLDDLLDLESPEILSAIVTLESLKKYNYQTSTHQIQGAVEEVVSDLVLASLFLPVTLAGGLFLAWLLKNAIRTKLSLETTQKQLDNSLQDLRLAQDMARLGSWTYDPESKTLDWSQQMFVLFDRDPALGPPELDEYQRLYQGEERERLQQAQHEAISEGKGYDLVFQMPSAQGPPRWIHGICQPDQQAQSSGYVLRGTVQDITAEKELEDRLRQSEKMDSIGQLAGGVAHDFNNQLSGIMGYAELLKMAPADRQVLDYTENILTCARRSADLTRKLLAYSRKGQMLNECVDIHAVLDEVVGILSHSIDKRILIRQRYQASTATVLGDASQLQNAILNLAINGRDAMPQGGELVFETSNVILDGSETIDHGDHLTPGEYLRLQVKDNGCGMTAELQRRIFEPFFTTKERGKGTGMGLAAVYGTIKGHSGAINIYSEPGVGSTFSLYLLVGGRRSSDVVIEQPDVAALSGLRILFVDDEEYLRAATAEILEAYGCQVHQEADGKSGVDYYREHWMNIDIVLIDMIMPKMGGEETFHAIRQIHRDARVLLVSGFSQEGSVKALLEAGAEGFVQKPFHANQLIDAILRVLRRDQQASSVQGELF